MSRYIGPKARISRRLGTPIWDTKGERSAREKRPYPPGEHGRTHRRSSQSEYLIQLQEKQKTRYIYGLSEKQFRRVFQEAHRRPGVTGENMLMFLELRLDNVIYRAGWASTRTQARQFVSHGHVEVNGKRVNIPSYRVRQDDKVSLRPKAREMLVVRWNQDMLERPAPLWLELLEDKMAVKVMHPPTREQIDTPTREQLIVELYSK